MGGRFIGGSVGRHLGGVQNLPVNNNQQQLEKIIMAEQGSQTAQAPAITTMEAGFSMNVKMIDANGQEVMLTFRAPQAHQAERLIEHYNTMIGKLINAGWQPLKAAVRAPQENGQASSGALPVCRVHGSPMKESRKPGSFYCPRKDGESWCKEKVG
jgi:hypothetical protein